GYIVAEHFENGGDLFMQSEGIVAIRQLGQELGSIRPEKPHHGVVPRWLVVTAQDLGVCTRMVVEDRHRHEPIGDQFYHQWMRQDVLPKAHARRTPWHFLEQQQNRLALFGRERQGLIVIAQPPTFAELAMLAKGETSLLHASDMVRPVRKTITRQPAAAIRRELHVRGEAADYSERLFVNDYHSKDEFSFSRMLAHHARSARGQASDIVG